MEVRFSATAGLVLPLANQEEQKLEAGLAPTVLRTGRREEGCRAGKKWQLRGRIFWAEQRESAQVRAREQGTA